ncbi:cytochrome c [Sulfurimonas sp.]|uniref:c-type cytochrome n=1 Tax=Sulfurimonas sp. TaxID=2022749 RepID=UPI0035693A08
MVKIIFLMLSVVSISFATQLFDKCGICHGVKGEKHSLGLTKSIAGMQANDVAKILYEYKNGTRNIYGLGTIMNGQAKNLSEDEIETLSKYIESLPKVEPKELAQDKKELTPEEVFKKCAICHGDAGQKKSLGVSKHIAGMKAEEVIKILKQYRAGERNTYNYGSMMQGQATKLTDKQMDDVAEYIESLTPVEEDAIQEKTTKPKKKITKEEADYNKFMEEYFRKSKNPNETLEEAKKRYQEEQKKLKEKNE